GVEIGRGYEAADRKATAVPTGAVQLDAAYSPITRVSYNTEMSRLGKITDYEKLIVEIWTNGSVGPEEAMARAADYLKGHFSPLAVGASELEADGDEASGEEFLREALGRAVE